MKMKVKEILEKMNYDCTNIKYLRMMPYEKTILMNNLERKLSFYYIIGAQAIFGYKKGTILFTFLISSVMPDYNNACFPVARFDPDNTLKYVDMLLKNKSIEISEISNKDSERIKLNNMTHNL